MNKIIKLLIIFSALLVLTGCSTAVDTLSDVFEKMNDSDPLPKDYSRKASASRKKEQPTGDLDSFSTYSAGANYSPGANQNKSREETFQDWHNSQFK